MIKVECISDYEEFKRLRESWEELREKQPAEDMIFLAHGWFDCWWRSYSDGAKLFILLARKNNRLVGIAPFMVRQAFVRGLPTRLVSFIDNGNSGHNDFIIDAAVRQEVLKAFFLYLRKDFKSWDVLELKRIPPESGNFCLIPELLRHDHFFYIEKMGTNAPYLRTDDKAWTIFYDRLSSKKKKNLRNIRNRISREGNYEVKSLTSFSDYERVRPDLREIVRNSWSAYIESSLNRPQNAKFMNLLSQWAGERGWLQIWLLSLQDKPIAFEYHLKYHDRVHGLRSSFNKNFAHLSPGVLLDYHIVKAYFKRDDIAEYDMGGNADFYKRQWTKEAREHKTFQIFSLNPYSKVIYFYEWLWENILWRLKKICFP